MKFSHRLKSFVSFYFWAILLIGILIYFDAFKEPSEFLSRWLVLTAKRSFVGATPPWYHVFLASVVAALLPSIYILRVKMRRTLLLLVLTGLFILGITFAILVIKGILFPILYLEIAFVIGIFAAMILKIIFASSEQEFLRLAFSQFVSQDVLRELLKDPNKLKLQGKQAELTIMFIDIRGFTAFSEKNHPVVVVNKLNDLLDKVTHIILENKGTVDKYIGDAVMAMWGAPTFDKKQATHACEAALKIREIIQNHTEFKVGIGINSGHAIIGNIGSTKRFDYTAIGDTVNTAARLESATKDLGEPIVLSDSVAAKLKEEGTKAHLRDLGVIKVKGKANGIKVHALI